MTTIEIFLGFSILLNVILSWFVYKLLRNLIDIEEGFQEIKTKLIEFATHLKGINKVIYEDDMEDLINDNEKEEN